MTIHGISTGLNFMSYVDVPNSNSVVNFPIVDFGWWMTILWMVGDHPLVGWLPSLRWGLTIRAAIGFNFVS